MAKRRREDEDSDNAYGGESHTEELENDVHSDLQDAVNQVIRLVLIREPRGQFIRRDHVVKYLGGRKISYDTVMTQVRSELEEVYGMTLVEVPVQIQSDAGKKKTKVKPRPHLALVTKLNSETRSVLGEIWHQAAKRHVDNGRDLQSDGYFLPKNSKTDTPSTNHELVKTGLMVVVISLIILSENRLSDHDMVKALELFGINSSMNVRNSNYHLNSVEYLDELAKKEYIVKDTDEGVTNYILGRRALVEFSPQCVFEYVRTIYGEDFTTAVGEQTLVTIERVYGKVEADTVETSEGALGVPLQVVLDRDESVTAPTTSD